MQLPARLKRPRVVIAFVVLVGATALFLGTARAANAGAVITNGVITLGINDQGHLNFSPATPMPSCEGTIPVGLRFNVTGCDFTAPGCLCEGWGAADATTGTSGYADVSTDGVVNLTLLSFTSTPTTAVSKTQIPDASGTPVLEVTHDYHPSLGGSDLPPGRPGTANLYEDVVSIKNVSGSPVDLRYRRVMDWDMEPTAFHEFVTIDHFGPPPTDLLDNNDDGFATANPLGPDGGVLFFSGLNFFTDSGPADHGARFDFGFGSLAPDATKTFTTFYGATGTEAEANLAIADVGAELWSYGQCDGALNPACSEITGTPNTAIFAFGGVGGTPPPPPAPTCSLIATIPGPPKSIQVEVQSGAGLATIAHSETNAVTVVPPFAPGDTSPVVVTSTKVNQSLASTLQLTVTDVAGKTTVCDPVVPGSLLRAHTLPHRLVGMKHLHLAKVRW